MRAISPADTVDPVYLTRLLIGWLQSLAGAKKVHAFVRDADDTIEWIEEKDLVASSEDYGQDIESIKALTVKHGVFEVSPLPD